MIKDELLIRAVHAAKVTREKGFTNTADALDEIVKSLLETYRYGPITFSKKTTIELFETEHRH